MLTLICMSFHVCSQNVRDGLPGGLTVKDTDDVITTFTVQIHLMISVPFTSSLLYCFLSNKIKNAQITEFQTLLQNSIQTALQERKVEAGENLSVTLSISLSWQQSRGVAGQRKWQ